MSQYFTKKRYKRDTLLYLGALQFIVVAIHPLVTQTFDLLSEADTLKITATLRNKERVVLPVVLNVLLEHLPDNALKCTLQQMKKLLSWGDYFVFNHNRSDELKTLREKSNTVLKKLQLQDKAGFRIRAGTVRCLCLCAGSCT